MHRAMYLLSILSRWIVQRRSREVTEQLIHVELIWLMSTEALLQKAQGEIYLTKPSGFCLSWPSVQLPRVSNPSNGSNSRVVLRRVETATLDSLQWHTIDLWREPFEYFL